MSRKRNTVIKSGKHVVSFSGDGREHGSPELLPVETTKVRREQATGPPQLLTVEETAEVLRCSQSTLNKWRVAGEGPRFVNVGRRVRYRRADLETFITSSIRQSTSEVTPTA